MTLHDNQTWERRDAPYGQTKLTFQGTFLGQTLALRCEGFPTFRELTMSPFSGCDGFGATKPPAHPGGLVTPKPTYPEDGDKFRTRNARKPSHPDANVCPRKVH
jgi:hypothetical protein